MKRFAIAAMTVLLAAAPLPGVAVTAAGVSACAGTYAGGQTSCSFEYVGIRVAPWAVATHDTRSVVVEVRMPQPGGGYWLMAHCTASSAAPMCIGQVTAVPAQPYGQPLTCHIRGGGRAVYGCFSQAAALQSVPEP